MTGRKLSCRELIDFIAAYLGDELASEERGAFESHLSGCAPCVNYLASYRKTIHLEKRALVAEDEDLASVPAELVDAILAARSRG
jgi:anti-sigma factor RsiW